MDMSARVHGVGYEAAADKSEESNDINQNHDIKSRKRMIAIYSERNGFYYD